MSIMNSTFSGDSNQGTQVGSNSGNIYFHNYGQPDGSRSPVKPKPSSTVPFRRDPDFVDRVILAEVDKICSKPASRAALVGLGGVGKSQLAIEYSYRVQENFPQTWIFWVHASNAARFEEGYRTIADRVKLPRREQTTDILRLVSNWLSDETNGRWIMILDNADDSTVFSDPRTGATSDVGAAVSLSFFLPQTPNGSILVTSRSEDAALRLTGRHRDIVKVDPMDEDCALLLFENKLRNQFDKNEAKELLRALDYMPLAISQAAAYISQRAPRTTVAKYLDSFRKSDKNQTNLLNTDTGDLRRDSSASNSIITTWQISFEYLRAKRPSAARLLSLMSFFDRQGIPKSLLHCYDDRDDSSDIKVENNADEDWKDDRADDREIDVDENSDIDLEDSGDMTFEDEVFTLTSYSLIRANVKNDHFEMHRLVQFSTRKWLELNCELEKWKKKYIVILHEAFPTGDYKNWTICRVLLPHAKAALAYRPKEKKYLLFWCEILSNAGWYAESQGRFFTAEEMSRKALEGRTKALGGQHLDTVTSINDLATVLRNQGKYQAAEAMSRRALNGYEKALGREHVHTLKGVSNLMLVLRDQGKYEAAEELSRRAVNGYEKALGREHLHTLTSVSILAMVLWDQGKYEAAEELNRRALSGREKALGKEHPHTLTSVSNLASSLRDQAKYDAAEQLSRRALDGMEKALGKEHPHTLTSVSNLASILQDQAKYDAAEQLSRRALDGMEKALGKEHPETLMSISKLASVLHSQGKYEAAEKLNRRALDGREKALGKEHPDTLASIGNLALVLQNQGKYEAAEELNRRALNRYEKALGKEHPDTLTSVHCLAVLLRRQKQYGDATELYERACAGRQKVLGYNHPKTLACSRNYASMIKEMEKANRESTFSGKGEITAGHPFFSWLPHFGQSSTASAKNVSASMQTGDASEID